MFISEASKTRNKVAAETKKEKEVLLFSQMMEALICDAH